MPVGTQYLLWSHLLCRYIDCLVCRPWNTQHIIVHVRSNPCVDLNRTIQTIGPELC
jgi:hypothetical protein